MIRTLQSHLVDARYVRKYFVRMLALLHVALDRRRQPLHHRVHARGQVRQALHDAEWRVNRAEEWVAEEAAQSASMQTKLHMSVDKGPFSIRHSQARAAAVGVSMHQLCHGLLNRAPLLGREYFFISHRLKLRVDYRVGSSGESGRSCAAGGACARAGDCHVAS